MNRKSVTWAAIALGGLTVILSGCTSSSTPVSSRQVPTGLDATAERLHDICGSMLLFHGAYRRMSESLDELCLATGLSPDGILDPLTGKAFLYEPKGFAASPGGRKVVLLAAPKDEHSTCWGISISQADRSLSAKVVSLPRSAYESLAEGQAPTTGQQVRDEDPGS